MLDFCLCPDAGSLADTGFGGDFRAPPSFSWPSNHWDFALSPDVSRSLFVASLCGCVTADLFEPIELGLCLAPDPLDRAFSVSQTAGGCTFRFAALEFPGSSRWSESPAPVSKKQSAPAHVLPRLLPRFPLRIKRRPISRQAW